MSTECLGCGRQTSIDARFCGACGTRLASSDEETTDAFDPVEEVPHGEDRERFPVECGLFVGEYGP